VPRGGRAGGAPLGPCHRARPRPRPGRGPPPPRPPPPPRRPPPPPPPPPARAVARRPGAHARETVAERREQLAYDLAHREALAAYGVPLEATALRGEQATLATHDHDALVERPYDDARLDAIRQRQRFVLDRLMALGTVIECCPTSNLLIGGVPDPAHHPLHRFLAAGVDVVLCSDDPGTFGITLASEIDWAVAHTGLDRATLARRLGDPRRFRLGQRRRTAG